MPKPTKSTTPTPASLADYPKGTGFLIVDEYDAKRLKKGHTTCWAFKDAAELTVWLSEHSDKTVNVYPLINPIRVTVTTHIQIKV